jgi:hypothetical protein
MWFVPPELYFRWDLLCANMGEFVYINGESESKSGGKKKEGQKK